MTSARSLSLVLFCVGLSSLLLSCKGPDVPEPTAFASFDAGISKDTSVSVDSVAKEDIKEPGDDVSAELCGPEGS
ncbi:MAG TPA: hypothetical protein DCQ06_11530, partial [Myxococcales bacterium]|nr:hypothetical protein [Myxococcales bacterium]